MKYILKTKSSYIFTIIMSLLTLGLFFSYYFFVPVIYGAIIFSIFFNSKENGEKIFSIKNIINFIYIIIIPTICGMYYMFFKGLASGHFNSPIIAVGMDGRIYSNIISNLLIFIPLAIFYFFYCIKNKKDIFTLNLTIFGILFIITLGIGRYLQIVSNYYFFKAYYLLWIIIIYINYKMIITLERKVINVLPILYILFMILSVGIFNNSIYIYDIYDNNYKVIKSEEYVFKNEYFEIVDYYNENLVEFQNDILMETAQIEGRERWIYSLFGNPIFAFFGEKINDINDWLELDEKYFIYYKEDFDYEPIENSEKYEILFNNSVGAILKKRI